MIIMGKYLSCPLSFKKKDCWHWYFYIFSTYVHGLLGKKSSHKCVWIYVYIDICTYVQLRNSQITSIVNS